MTDRVEPVGVREIAERLGVSQGLVSQWRFRGYLPEPRWTVSGLPAWNWPDIARWAKQTGRGNAGGETPGGTARTARGKGTR